MIGDIQLSLSVMLLAGAVAMSLSSRRRRSPAHAAVAVGFTLVSALSACFLAADHFTGRGIDESVLYHVEYGLEGAGFSEYTSLTIGVLALAALGIGVAIAFYLFAHRFGRAGSPERPLATGLLVLAACIVNPATTDGMALVRGTRRSSTAFERYYRKPTIVAHRTPDEGRRNLVFLYLESLERTYLDQQRFPGLIRHLSELEKQATSFIQIDQLPGTEFTMAGLVASQCGIPLVTASEGNSMSGMDSFLPGATCLGDLLRSDGYHLSFMGGAPSAFAGKQKFLATHGFHSIQGLADLRPRLRDPAYVSTWGIYDDSLLQYVYDEFEKLSRAEAPFALFTLTLDTHDGNASRSVEHLAKAHDRHRILGAVAGSDQLTFEFVQKVRSSEWSAQTTIVLASDHLAMASTAPPELNGVERRNLLMIINGQDMLPGQVAKRGTTLDTGPTVLRALGMRGDIGLGRDLLGPEPTLLTELPSASETIAGWRSELSNFWDFSPFDAVEVAADGRRVRAAGRTADIPTLIAFGHEVQPSFYFEVDSFARLTDHMQALPTGQAFVWVDRFENVRAILPVERSGDTGFWMVAGKKGAQPVSCAPLAEARAIDAQTLQAVLGSQPSPEFIERFARIALPEEIDEVLAAIPQGGVLFVAAKETANSIRRFAERSQRGVRVQSRLPEAGDFFFFGADREMVERVGGSRLARLELGERLIDFLNAHREDTIVVAVKDEAKAKLSADTLAFFESRGVRLSKLRFRGSFAAVLEGGNVRAQGLDNSGPVVLENDELRALGVTRVTSAGFAHGDLAEIQIRGIDRSPNRRGLNIVVLGASGELIIRHFDTALSERRYANLFHAVPTRAASTTEVVGSGRRVPP